MEEKKHKKWDPSLWQGRSEHQVESNYKVLGWAISGAIIFSVICYIASFIFKL